MSRSFPRCIPPHAMALTGLFVCFTAAYAWVLDCVIEVQYNSTASYFVFDRAFLSQWLDHPGGLLLYAGRFLRQFFHYEWLGALLVAALVTGLGSLLHGIRRRLAPDATLLHTVTPCLFVGAIYSASTLTLGLLVACAAYLLYLCLPQGRVARLGAALATLPLYLLAGGHLWLFVVWVGITESWYRGPQGRLFALGYPLVTLGLPLAVQQWVFPLSTRAAWLYPVDLPRTLLERAFLVYVLLLPVWPRLPVGHRLPALLATGRGRLAQAAVLGALGVTLLAAAYDPAVSRFAAYDRDYQRGQWDAILARAQHDPPADPMSQFFTNYALYRTGRLLEEMFRYPQPWGTRGLVPDFPDQAEQLHRSMYASDLYLELGHVNAAYRMAFNQLGFEGPTYANLRRMVECSVASGNADLARKHIRVLQRTLFHRGYAQAYRALLDDPGAAARQFAALRARRPTVELDVNLGEFAALLALVQSNPHNRMAVDYLTAWCLLDKACLPFVVQDVQRYRDAGYTVLPRHVQEAMMLWETLSHVPVERQGFTYSAAAATRFLQFEKRLRQLPATPQAQQALRPDFGDTYPFYYVATETPMEGTPTWAWYRLGNELYATGRRQEALLCFDQALLKHPDAAQTYPRLGSGVVLPAPEPAAPAASPAEAEWQLRSH